MRKRLLAMAMALIMAMSLLPMSAFAADGDTSAQDHQKATQAEKQIEGVEKTETTLSDPVYYTYTPNASGGAFSEAGEPGAVVTNIDHLNIPDNSDTEDSTEPDDDTRPTEKVKISKTIEPTGIENQFDITLNVETHEAIRVSNKQSDAAVVLVIDMSKSMGYCATCGKATANSNLGGTLCTCGNSISRLNAAKNAAKEFLYAYAGFTKGSVEQDVYNNPGAHRYVSIVMYSGNTTSGDNDAQTVVMDSTTSATWLDLHGDSEGDATNALTSVNGIIDDLSLSTDGYTNTDAGLKKAQGQLTDSTVTNIDNKFLVLLTDGEPNKHADTITDDNTYVLPNWTNTSGTSMYNQSPYDNDNYKNPAKRAYYIHHTLGTTFYSISFTTGDTVSGWMNSYSDKCISADDIDGLQDAFASIIYRLLLSVQAWTVYDPMGDYIKIANITDEGHASNSINKSTDNKSITWHLQTDLLGSNTKIETNSGDTLNTIEDYNNFLNDGDGTVTIKYSLTYRVILDVAALAKSEKLVEGTNYSEYVRTNGVTKLEYTLTSNESTEEDNLVYVEGTNNTYYIDDAGDPITSDENVMLTLYFKVPAVKGYVGDLSFTKVGGSVGGPALSGATFTLTCDDTLSYQGDWASQKTSASTPTEGDATAPEAGSVVFADLPSGHTYKLTETNAPEGYNTVDPISVEVEYGDVKTVASSTPGSNITNGILVDPYTKDSSGNNNNNNGNNKPILNTKDHYGYIIGYPVDYYTGEKTDDQTKKPVKPQGNITRAEVATIFFRMLTDESRTEYWSSTNSYTDVPETAWYNNAVSTLSNAGIIDGYNNGSFKPNGKITRAEFATIAVRFFDVEYNGEDLFPDIDGHWAQDYINQAGSAGIVNGYPDGTFGPQKLITRAEAVTMVNRTLDRRPDADHFLKDMLVWPDNMDTTKWYYADMQEATNSHEYQMKGSGSDKYEVWTKMLPIRDWEAFEKEWSDAGSASNPGDVVR